MVRGRYAPSPTGALHLGSARTLLAAWLSVRAQRGAFVWRVEDLDGPRTVPGAVQGAMDDARWLGIDWDEGPDATTGLDRGPHAPYAQSERSAHYDAALERLVAAGRVFPCRRSRKDLLTLASAPHGMAQESAQAAAGAMPGTDGLPPYPRAWRPDALPAPGWFRPGVNTGLDAAVRFRVDDGVACFDDCVQGRVCEDTAATVGDFVLKRRDGAFAYQLAVVVDDLAMGITEVVRGADLLASTARQRQLVRALGGAMPTYAHLGLVVNAHGEKLSKRDGAASLATLRERGVSPETVVGWLAHRLGLRMDASPCTAASLVADFAWARVPPGPVVAPSFASR